MPRNAPLGLSSVPTLPCIAPLSHAPPRLASPGVGRQCPAWHGTELSYLFQPWTALVCSAKSCIAQQSPASLLSVPPWIASLSVATPHLASPRFATPHGALPRKAGPGQASPTRLQPILFAFFRWLPHAANRQPTWSRRICRTGLCSRGGSRRVRSACPRRPQSREATSRS